MKSFSVDLVEDAVSHHVILDFKGQQEYVVHRRSGLLRRKYDQNWNSEAIALSSMEKARNYLAGAPRVNFEKGWGEEMDFGAGKVIRDNDFLIKYLQSHPGLEWKIIFRADQTRRIILRDQGKARRSNFIYHNVLVKFKPGVRNHYVEVGEGHVKNGHRFNQTGLTQRIEEICANHTESHPIHFSHPVPVVLSAGDGAILFHEILGHSLEADSVYGKMSPFSLADLGKKVVSEKITLVTKDEKDPFFKDVSCDDEGETPRSSILIRQGILQNFISDSFYKNLLQLKSAGHSRVENFTKIPLPRMFSLYLNPGEYEPGELVASTGYGVLAQEFGEGKVYFDRDLFYFNIPEAHLIENGKITAPLGSIVVRGKIMDTLNAVEMVANDFRLDKGIGFCLKSGQTLNVRVGQPTVKMSSLFVTKETND